MDMVRKEQTILDTCKSVACRVALWGLLLIGAGILCVGLPLAVLRG